MFDLSGGMGAIGQQMKAIQSAIAKEEVEGSVAGGKVRVRVNGAQEVLAVRIDPSLMNDREMLEDLMTAATNDAMRRSKEVAAEKMQAFMSSMGLPPGLF